MTFSLAIDLVVAGLLIATTLSCISISRKLADLRSGEGALKELVRELAAISTRAELALKELRAAAERTGAELSGETTRARALTGELSLMIDAADALATRLAARRANDHGPEPARTREAPMPSHLGSQLGAALRGAR